MEELPACLHLQKSPSIYLFLHFSSMLGFALHSASCRLITSGAYTSPLSLPLSTCRRLNPQVWDLRAQRALCTRNFRQQGTCLGTLSHRCWGVQMDGPTSSCCREASCWDDWKKRSRRMEGKHHKLLCVHHRSPTSPQAMSRRT